MFATSTAPIAVIMSQRVMDVITLDGTSAPSRTENTAPSIERSGRADVRGTTALAGTSLEPPGVNNCKDDEDAIEDDEIRALGKTASLPRSVRAV